MRQTPDWAAAGLIFLAASITATADSAPQTSREQLSAPAAEHHFTGGSPEVNRNGESFARKPIHSSGAISRVYRNSQSLDGNRAHISDDHHSTGIGVSIYSRHSYPSYRHRSHRQHQYGHGLRHFRHPGHKGRGRGLGRHPSYYYNHHRYGEGFRHGHRGSLHPGGHSGHGNSNGSALIRK